MTFISAASYQFQIERTRELNIKCLYPVGYPVSFLAADSPSRLQEFPATFIRREIRKHSSSVEAFDLFLEDLKRRSIYLWNI